MRLEKHRFVVRIPIPVHQRVSNAARQHRRSINAEIVTRLEHSFSADCTCSAAARCALYPDAAPHSELPSKSALSAAETWVVNAYRRLPQTKRHALLALLG